MEQMLTAVLCLVDIIKDNETLNECIEWRANTIAKISTI